MIFIGYNILHALTKTGKPLFWMHLNFELRLQVFRPNGTEVHSLQKKSFLCFQFVQLNFDLGSELEYEVLVDDLLMIFGPILNLSGF